MNDSRTQFSNQNFENPFPQNRSRLSQSSNSSTNSNNDQESLQFRPNQETDDSGVCSPPLWKNCPSPPSPSPSQPLLHHRRSLSPNSRIQAITKGQRELMEMVKNMPESSYELSLKDLVENQGIETQPPKLENRDLSKRVVVKVKRQESRKNERGLTRIESFESKSVFLKMGVPFSLKSSKRRKKNFVGNSSGRVSPKPEGGKGGERDWWKMRFSGSSDSNSSGRSNNSGGGGGGSGRSDSGRRLNGYFTGCWPFLQSRSSKSVD